MNDKKIINHNIFKINLNKFLLINTKKLKITLRILRDDQKQYFIKKKFKYYKIKSKTQSKNITIIYCKNIRKLRKFYNFYDKIVNFLT